MNNEGLVFGRRRTPAEFANFVMDCAAANPNGFRQPSTKYPALPTLAEQACVEAKMMGPTERPFDRRAKRKAKSQAAHVETVLKQQKAGLERASKRKFLRRSGLL